MIELVISGMQTGADRAGLDAARACGIKTGGWMPRGFKALDGCHPEFAALYGVRETESDKYPPRTAQNVADADATIRFATSWSSSGERCTMTAIRKRGKPVLDVDPRPFARPKVTPEDAAEWLEQFRVINVAGNSEQTSPGIYESTLAFLMRTFTLCKQCSWCDKPMTKYLMHQRFCNDCGKQFVALHGELSKQ